MPTARARLMIVLFAMLMPHAAMASLGGGTDTIGADQARMAVRAHVIAPSGGGNLHTLSLSNGGEVREYANAAGVIYAVRWTGPGKPALDSLLGANFAAFQTDNPIGRRHGLRRAPTVDRANLKIVTGGHTGSFWGYAWLPQSAPAGFNPASM